MFIFSEKILKYFSTLYKRFYGRYNFDQIVHFDGDTMMHLCMMHTAETNKNIRWLVSFQFHSVVHSRLTHISYHLKYRNSNTLIARINATINGLFFFILVSDCALRQRQPIFSVIWLSFSAFLLIVNFTSDLHSRKTLNCVLSPAFSA